MSREDVANAFIIWRQREGRRYIERFVWPASENHTENATLPKD